MGREFFQHANQLASVQGRQTGFQGIGADLVVQLGEQFEFMAGDFDNPIAMAAGVPDTLDGTVRLNHLFLDARHGTRTVMGKTCVDGLRVKRFPM